MVADLGIIFIQAITTTFTEAVTAVKKVASCFNLIIKNKVLPVGCLYFVLRSLIGSFKESIVAMTMLTLDWDSMMQVIKVIVRVGLLVRILDFID